MEPLTPPTADPLAEAIRNIELRYKHEHPYYDENENKPFISTGKKMPKMGAGETLGEREESALKNNAIKYSNKKPQPNGSSKDSSKQGDLMETIPHPDQVFDLDAMRQNDARQ